MFVMVGVRMTATLGVQYAPFVARQNASGCDMWLPASGSRFSGPTGAGDRPRKGPIFDRVRLDAAVDATGAAVDAETGDAVRAEPRRRAAIDLPDGIGPTSLHGERSGSRRIGRPNLDPSFGEP